MISESNNTALALEQESDNYIKGARRAGESIYTEAELRKQDQRHTDKSVPVEVITQPTPPHESRPIMSGLTKRQKKVARKMRRHNNDKSAVAQEMGVSERAVRAILKRAGTRISELLAKMDYEREECAEISDDGWWLWYAELATKRRRTYRKNTHPMQSKKMRNRR